MKNPLNGKTKIVTGVAGVAAVCSILSYATGVYAGWTKNVAQSVTDRQMLNAHDETLKAIVPKVETCHEVNDRQNWEIDQNARDIAALAETVKQTNGMVQLYLQGLMKRGEIAR